MTFRRFIGDIALDLNKPLEAVVAFEQALEFHYEIEIAVSLIKALCEAGKTDEASSRIKELHHREVSFLRSNDVESASKLLQVIGNCPEFAKSVDTNVLQDILMLVSKRGIDVLTLKPFGLQTPVTPVPPASQKGK